MGDLNLRFERLGRAVSEVSDAGADGAVLATARRRFLRQGVGPSSWRRRGAWLAVAAVACLSLIGGARWLSFSSPAVSFEVGDPPRRGGVGVWIAADREAAVPLRFSEGSKITAAPGALIRVTETSTDGADVLLERGSVSASVVHTSSRTRWALRAGPFEVRVTGTAFDASWDPSGESFELVMKEGSVIVSGPVVQTGRVVLAGERLHVSMRDERMEIGTLPPRPEASAIAVAPSAVAPSAAAVAPSAVAPSAVAVAPSAPPIPLPSASSEAAPQAPVSAPSSAEEAARPTFHDLLRAGRAREALEAAERDGFAQQIERATSGELLALSDAARFASRPAEAQGALLAMRRRFGVTGRSAFLLGKIAADQQHAFGDAANWFETYLREEPRGPLAEQALGRLVEIRQRGDRASARATAERYLAAYPGGSYAAVARSIVAP